jgi:hypothetical protein
MRRSLSFRLFAALFAPWFAVVVAEPVPLHDCPMHSLHPAAAHPMASSSVTPAGGRGMSGMAHAGLEQSKSFKEHGLPTHPAHHQCCCMGASCATALAAIARVPHLAWIPVQLRSETVPTFAASFANSSAEHVLPFANGPPAARV